MEQDRAEFERWFEGHMMPAEAGWFEREQDSPDEYKYPLTDIAWKAWQVAKAGDPPKSIPRDEFTAKMLIAAYNA